MKIFGLEEEEKKIGICWKNKAYLGLAKEHWDSQQGFICYYEELVLSNQNVLLRIWFNKSIEKIVTSFLKALHLKFM